MRKLALQLFNLRKRPANYHSVPYFKVLFVVVEVNALIIEDSGKKNRYSADWGRRSKGMFCLHLSQRPYTICVIFGEIYPDCTILVFHQIVEEWLCHWYVDRCSHWILIGATSCFSQSMVFKHGKHNNKYTRIFWIGRMSHRGLLIRLILLRILYYIETFWNIQNVKMYFLF